jgi:hypothetical protein
MIRKQIVEELPMRIWLVVETLCIPILLALSASQVSAGCLNPPVSAQAIGQFKSNPKALVATDTDTRTIEALVRDLAGTDASLAADLVHVAQGTMPRFQTAIAAGLAQAAIACSGVDQQAGLLIQEAVASFQDGQFQASFAAVAGDLSTAATAAATESATGSAGSVVITNPNTSARPALTFGGGGAAALILFGAPSSVIDTTSGGASNNSALNNSAPSDVATTAAAPVSSTR